MTSTGQVPPRWGTSSAFPSRAHLVWGGWSTAVCGLPVDQSHDRRRYGYRICPECAIGFVGAVFPTTPPLPGHVPVPHDLGAQASR